MAKDRYRIVGQPVPTTEDNAQALADHRDSLYRRLELGYQRIERGLAEGQDVAAWEDFWCALLQDYERVCTELTAARAAGPLVQGQISISAGVR